MAFHGNMQVAIAEARTLVEAGSRVAFFAASTGEVERLADILNEYGSRSSLALDQSETTPALPGRAGLHGGSGGQHLPGEGHVRRGHRFRDSKLVVFGSEDLFEASELVAARALGRKPAVALSRRT